MGKLILKLLRNNYIALLYMILYNFYISQYLPNLYICIFDYNQCPYNLHPYKDILSLSKMRSI